MAAAIAAAGVAIELALAQLTLGLTVTFVIVGRISRWRASWLALPAAIGLYLTLQRGPGPAVAGYLAAARHVIGFLSRPGPAAVRLARPWAAFAGWRDWLPGQLPVALIAAAAQAGAVGRVRRDARPLRPGALVAARRAYLTASLRRGEVATGEGGCVGIVAATGRRAEISWLEAEAGVLVTGTSADVTRTGTDLAIAAIQHRKAVIIIDLTPGAGEGAGRRQAAGAWTGAGGGQEAGARYAAGAGRGARPGEGAAAEVAAACAASDAPLLRLGGPDGRYDPISRLPAARAARLIMAMLDWQGAPEPVRSLCATYLQTALEVSAAAGAPAGNRAGMIGDLAGLARPDGLRQRIHRADLALRTPDALVRRAAEGAGRLVADSRAEAALDAAAGQLSRLASAAVGRWLGPAGPAGGEPVSLARAVARRQVVHAWPDPRRNGWPAVMVARLLVADLTGVLAERAGLGLPADCLVWIDGCEAIGRGLLSDLVAVGRASGTSVVLGATDGAAAADLAGLVNVVVERAARPGEISLRVRGPRQRLIQGCRAVR